MRILRLVAIAVAATLLAAGQATAERRIALVIGNSGYDFTSNLANPGNDAALMAETLEEVGFEVTRLADADQQTMKRAMLDFGRALREDVDASLFYYAGHGVQADGVNYLIPTDAAIGDEAELDFQAIDVNAFLRVMERSTSRVNIVVLDACRNNPFESNFRSASRGLAMVDAPKGTYIAYSTAPGEVADDGTTGNSPYTSALAEAMVTPGLKIEDTFKEARSIVLERTAERQVPWETSSITGDFYFVRPQAPRPAATTTPAPSAESGPLPFQADTTAALAWSAIQNSVNPGDYRAFIETFGDASPFLARLAADRIRLLGEQPVAALQPAPAAKAPAVETPAVAVPGGTGRAVLVPQIGHHDWIRGVAWAPDGRRIASGADDNSVRIWDIETGRIIRTLAGHANWVRGVDWSPDGTLIASVAQDGRAILWDYATGERHATMNSSLSGLLAVAFSPDGRLLATGGYGGKAEIWDAGSGRLVATSADHSDWIRSVAWSPDGRWLATGSDDGTVKIWGAADGSLRTTLEGHTDYLRSVDWSPDGELLATASNDDTVRIWDWADGRLARTVDSVFDQDVAAVAWSPDGTMLATSDDTLTARIFDRTGFLLRSFDERYETVQALAWSPDGRTLATGGSGRVVRLWNPLDGAITGELAAPGAEARVMALAPDGRRLAIGYGGSDIDIWDLRTGRILQRMSVETGTPQTMAWSHDGDRLAVGGSSNKVRMFDAHAGSLLFDIAAHDDWVRSVAWSPDDRFIVSGSDDKLAIIWDAQTGARTRTYEGHTDWVRAVAWSPDNEWIATGADDKEIRIWGAQSGRLKSTITAEYWPYGLFFSPDATRLLSVHNNSEAVVWNVPGGARAETLDGPSGSVNTAQWLPGRGLIAGVDIWDDDARLRGSLDTRSELVKSVAWSPTLDIFVTLRSDGALQLWRADDYGLAMRVLLFRDRGLAALYADGTGYIPDDLDELVAIVAGNEVVPSRAGHEHLFRSSYSIAR